MKILEPTAKKSKARSALMSAIIDHQAKFGVPCQLRAIQNLMKDHSEGKVILPVEFKIGASTVANDEEVVEMVKTLATFKNRVITKDVIREKLNEIRRKRMDDAGIAVLNDIEVSESTVNNYRALLCCDGNLSIASSYIDKTNNRFIAENSIRAALSTLFTVCVTHLLHVDEYDAATKKELKELPTKITALLMMVSDEWGKCLIPIAAYYIYSTDDTTEYVFDGRKKNAEKFVLVSREAVANSGTNSYYQVDDCSAMNGLRVKFTFTFSAAGTCFPLCITVAGLTDREMPGNDEFVHVKIPGLCIGGGGVNIHNREYGHLLFMKNTEGAEKRRVHWYHREIFVPGVNDHRLYYDNFDASSGREIPYHCTAVAWCDGEGNQIHELGRSIELFRDNKIIANKQHASRSGVEQPADLAKVFPVLHKQYANSTCKDIPREQCPLKAFMLDAFDNELSFLKLAPAKKAAIIDMICVTPDAASKACTKENIRHGFIHAGIIDDKKYKYPVFDKILGTVARAVSTEEYCNVLDNFGKFLEAATDEGIISEEVFDECGVVRDKDKNGREVLRDAMIATENQQRAKNFSHEHQVHMRNERILQINDALRGKREVARLKLQDRIDREVAVVDKLLDWVEEETGDEVRFLDDTEA